jgi:hypothetical protein
VSELGWIGVWLLVAGGVAIVVEAALMGIWTAAVAKRSRTLAHRLESERAQIQANVDRLRLALEEMQVLWQPYRRVLRWLRHPLVVALIASYRRRWAAR